MNAAEVEGKPAGVYEGDIASVLITEQEIALKVDELAKEIAADRPPERSGSSPAGRQKTRPSSSASD